MRVQQIAPIYTEKLGRLGWINRENPFDSLTVAPNRFVDRGTVIQPGTRSFVPTRMTLGQLRDQPAGSNDAGDLGQVGYSVATTFGAALGGGLIGLVAGRAKTDPIWRGAIFSGSLAGIGNSMSHLRNDKSKALGAVMMIGSLWGMWWSFKPLVTGQYGGT
jgi:hypothetical protein